MTAGNVVPIRSRGGPVNLTAWRAYATATLTKPPTITATAYQNATDSKRAEYDLARARYHRGLSSIVTRQMQQAHDKIDNLLRGSDGCHQTARTGLVLNGLPFLGKSTILLAWGKRFEHDVRVEEGVTMDARTSDGALFVPAVYVILGENDGPKGLCQKLMRFYDEPYRDSWNESELTARLHRLTVSCGTRVILIDQMQNLRMANRSAQQTAEHLKILMDTLPVTVIGAGVDMDSTGFLTEGRRRSHADLAQTAYRFQRFDIVANDFTTRQGREDWEALVNTVGDRLILLRKRSGELVGLADYLHERTGGITGQLMDLLRQAANSALGNEERLTRDVLDRIEISRPAANDHPTAEDDVRAAAVGGAIRRVRRASAS